MRTMRKGREVKINDVDDIIFPVATHILSLSSTYSRTVAFIEREGDEKKFFFHVFRLFFLVSNSVEFSALSRC